MKSSNRSLALTIMLCLLSGLASACTRTRTGTSGPGVVSPPMTGSLVMTSARVDLAPASIRSSGAAQLTLLTPEGRTMVLVRGSQERIGEAGIAWHGRVADDPASTVTIVENRGAVAGTIHSPTATYRLRGGPGGVYIDRLDPARFPDEANPIEQPGLRDGGADPALDTCATDSGDNIDIMVVYTDDTRAAAGGVAQMEAEVYLAVAVTNQAYLNSNVTQRLRLVHTAEVNYAETGNSLTDLQALQSPADPLGMNVGALRNTFAADFVMMLTETLDACGRAYVMSSVGNAFNAFAFGVTARSCASANLSFPHELGHNMGARHDWDTDSADNSPFHFNHGHRIPSTWRTVMSYQCTLNCPRIPNFSNPAVTVPPVGGTATGTSAEPQPTDNAQTLNQTAQTGANFRCSSPGRTDVWMKDRWNDTGVEPEPLTAGQPMWESPYIWVRNAQDTTLVHQHEHQNPEFGSPNWAYVKLHNGSAAQTGTLHLYVAAASTGLSWPGSFTQIGAIPVTINANSTRVIEIPWPTLPGTGHYCLVARWVSSSDPMHAEGVDINANTIANNNIVWRNVNIIDQLDPSEDQIVLRVRNPNPRNAALTTLRFVMPRNANGLSYARFGDMAVTLDPRLLRQAQDGVRPTGMTYGDEGWALARGLETAELRGLVLPAGAEGEVRIRLPRPAANAPRDVFRLRVEQWEEGPPGTRTAGMQRLVGGVTYDIRTDRRRQFVAPRTAR